MNVEIKIPRKLIEVALPLDSINLAAAHEKQPGIGAHPRGLHLWWARRPLAAARAVIFAQMVNDPGYDLGLGSGLSKEDAQRERERLFSILKRLVLWENTNNEEILVEARAEIARSWREVCEINRDHPQAADLFNPDILPPLHDPFAGGGAIPLEAQRLGLEAFASDLNPVAVAINKAMIEIPPRFINTRPCGPTYDSDLLPERSEWPGVTGLAEDVKRYGAWINSEARKRIGHLYPTLEVTARMVEARSGLSNLKGKKLNVLTWIWVRTVKSPNPVFSNVDVPLASSFVLCKKGKREIYVEPVIEGEKWHFVVRDGKTPTELSNGTKLARGANFKCILSDSPIEPEYIKAQGQAGRIGTRLMAIVCESKSGKVYLSPDPTQERAALDAQPGWLPQTPLPDDPRNFWTLSYGLTTFGSLFTNRQLATLNALSDLVAEAVEKCQQDAVRAGLRDDKISLEDGGSGAKAYAEAVGVYLSFAVSRLVDYGSSIATWKPTGEQVMQTFKRQALPMTWDFPESHLLGEKAICWLNAVKYSANNLEKILPEGSRIIGKVYQVAAQNQNLSLNKVVSTDPPYYDNIGYADLSDFFYVWLTRTLGSTFPTLFSSPTTPKDNELVANQYRHGGKARAEDFFLSGMKLAIQKLSEMAHPAFPVTIYYAFKQSETKDGEGTSSTGWETFLDAVLSQGFSITGTWPLRTELSNRMISSGTNALASSILLVCKKRNRDAAVISRTQFVRELNTVLPRALEDMTTGVNQSPVAPVDLSQAIIGPGMAIFSKYSAVLEANGNPMSVRTALQVINRFLTQDDFDHDTQFCLTWFDGVGWAEGRFGEADVLARAKGTSVEGLKDAGVLRSGNSVVALIKPEDLPNDWSPENDTRISIWEILHHMIRSLDVNGTGGAGEVLAKASNYSDSVKTLAYRLFTLCERKGWASDAGRYDGLVRAWDSIEDSARAQNFSAAQISLFGEKQAQTSEKNKSVKKARRKK